MRVTALYQFMVVAFTQADDTDRMREQFERVLERSEFNYDKSLMTRFTEWLGRVIERLLDMLRIPGTSVGAGGASSGIATFIVAVVLIAIAVAVIVFAVRRFRRRRTDGEDEEGTSSSKITIRSNSPEDDWMAEFIRLHGADPAKMSILARYRDLVGALVDGGVVDGSAGSSPREIVEGAARAVPDSGPLITEATDIFEEPWYGEQPGMESRAERLDEIRSRILEDSMMGTAPRSVRGRRSRARRDRGDR